MRIGSHRLARPSCFATALALATATFLTAAPLAAQLAPPMSLEERCARYSEETLYQVEQARRLGCARSGTRWSTDYDLHHSWCLGQEPAALDSELVLRRKELDRCEAAGKSGDAQAAPPPSTLPLDKVQMMEGTLQVVPPAGADARCEAYALTAVAQQRQNEEQGCGQAGLPWNADADVHRVWCVHQEQATLDGETRARTAALRTCLRGREPAVGGDGRCTGYAATAVHQAALSDAHGCGLYGARWTPDFLLHYRWCIEQRGAEPDAETAERNRLLAGCGVPATPINIPGPVSP